MKTMFLTALLLGMLVIGARPAAGQMNPISQTRFVRINSTVCGSPEIAAPDFDPFAEMVSVASGIAQQNSTFSASSIVGTGSTSPNNMGTCLGITGSSSLNITFEVTEVVNYVFSFSATLTSCTPSISLTGPGTSVVYNRTTMGTTPQSFSGVLQPGQYTVAAASNGTSINNRLSACGWSINLSVSFITGSCCTNGACSVTTQANCAATWTNSGTCSPNLCPPGGACCVADGSCSVTTQAACSANWTSGGICAPNPCPQPTGACCTGTGSCVLSTASACSNGSLFLGTNITCTGAPCPTNVNCASAKSISASYFETLTPFGAAEYAPFCGSSLVTTNAVWYRLVGQGDSVLAQVCDNPVGASQTPNLHVYCAPTGLCGTNNTGLNCVGSGGGGGACRSVSFYASPGVTYYIAIFLNTLPPPYGLVDFSLVPTSPVAQSPCTADRCAVDLTGVTNFESEACSPQQTNFPCSASGVGTFALGVPFAGNVHTYGGFSRDIDAWRLNVPVPATAASGGTWIDVEYRVAFPGVLQAFSINCNTPLHSRTVSYLDGGPSCPRTPTTTTFFANSGSALYLQITAADFAGLPCSSQENTYRMEARLSKIGACCVPFTVCFVTIAQECALEGGRYLGDNSTCCFSGYATATSICGCAADVNASCGVSVQDIFDFMRFFFAGDRRADVNSSGVVSIQDIFDFLASFFTGC